jgi:hypothetical protein
MAKRIDPATLPAITGTKYRRPTTSRVTLASVRASAIPPASLNSE